MNNAISLSQSELHMAFAVALLRKSESRRLGLDGDMLQGSGGNAWDMEINGAIAEMAYCKFRGIYWSGSVGSYKGADVGKATQIRHTRYPNGKLIIRERDNDDHYYVLVAGHESEHKICGWLRGCDARKMVQYTRVEEGRETALFIPQSELKAF